MADASRRVSFWLSLATSWICCAWRARSAAANCSRRKEIWDWLPSTAGATAPHVPPPPRPDPPQRAAVKSIFVGQKAGQQAAGVFGLEAARELVGIPGHATYQAPLRPTRITPQTLTGNVPSS